jgi:hypothetical protein
VGTRRNTIPTPSISTFGSDDVALDGDVCVLDRRVDGSMVIEEEKVGDLGQMVWRDREIWVKSAESVCLSVVCLRVKERGDWGE